MFERKRIELELHQLRERLAEAWWNEEPLERIEQLEQEIESRSRQLRPETATT